VDDTDSAVGNGFKPGKLICLVMNGFRSNDFSFTQKSYQDQDASQEPFFICAEGFNTHPLGR
jgi:hypothetical protein